MITLTQVATGVRNLGEAAEGVVGSWVVHVTGTGTFSVTFRKKIRRGSVADASAPTTYYENFATGQGVAAGTAVVAAGLFKVPCDGCDLILDISYTSGTFTVEAEPLLG